MRKAQASIHEIGPDFVAHRVEMPTVELEGDAIIYDEQREVAHLLTPTGAIVWSLLDGQVRLGELATDLAEAFGASREDVLGDVMVLVGELAQRGLLANVSPTADIAIGSAHRTEA